MNDDADMHIGPVADDNVYQSIRLFETGAYDAEYTVKKLKTEVLHEQWTLHTDEIILMEDAACIPIAYFNDYWLQSDQIEGSWHSSAGYWYFMYADINSEAH